MESLPAEIKAILEKQNRDWSDFGLLWEWTQKQKWWRDLYIAKFEEQADERFSHCSCPTDRLEDFINPDRFANAVYDYLKRQEGICLEPWKMN